MAFESGGKGKADMQFREELRVLSTQIEAINQQLSGGGGSGGGPAATKAFNDLSMRMQYLYELIKTLQTDLKSEVKTSFTETQKAVTTTLQKNLGDLYANHQDTLKAIQSLQKQLAGSPMFNAQDLTEMKTTIASLVQIYRQEVDVFKDQNAYLQKKLDAIEDRLAKLEK